MRLRTGLVGLLVAGSMAIGGTALAADHETVDGTGPREQVVNGQINHGHFVSNFVRALKLQLNEAGRKGGIGCLVRLVAQSSDGRAEGQGTPTTDGLSSTGAMILALGDASCEPGGEVETRADGNGPGNGKGHAYGHSKGVGNPHNANR